MCMKVEPGKVLNLLLIFAFMTLCQMNIWAQTAPKGNDAVSGADQEKPARNYGKANKENIKCFVVLLRLRYDLYGKWKDTGKWPNDKEANQALSGHGAYWNEQLKKGKVILTGGMDGEYWDNVALIIFEAGSEKEAKEIVANDPAVKAYVFQAQVRPFNVLSLTNKFADK